MIASIYFENRQKIQIECEKIEAEYTNAGNLIGLSFEGLKRKRLLYIDLSKVMAVIRED